MVMMYTRVYRVQELSHIEEGKRYCTNCTMKNEERKRQLCAGDKHLPLKTVLVS